MGVWVVEVEGERAGTEQGGERTGRVMLSNTSKCSR